MVELRARVMRADLERLGVYDPSRVRVRFLDAYVPQNTRAIVVGGAGVGLVAVRHEEDARWIEHFYLDPSLHGQGIGGAILGDILGSAAGDLPFRLNVLQGSAAQRLYERHGFRVESSDDVDVFMVRHPRD